MVNRLNPEQRQRDLNMLVEEDFEVAVVGGGLVGAGIALDAASRGLRTALIEAQDWASGTSGRSTGLALEGLSHLAGLDPKVALELVRERSLLLDTIAPHLVKPQSFIWPMRAGLAERAQVAGAVAMHDLLTATVGGRSLPPHRKRSRSGTIARFPDVNTESLVGSVEFQDARLDDARLVVALVRTALEYGACPVSRAEAVRMTRSATAMVTGLVVRDLETGEERHLRTSGVIVATGVWTEQTEALAQTDPGLKVLASKGVHIMVPKDRINASTGIYARSKDCNLVIVPRANHWLIGTTDTAWHHSLAHPVATSQDVDTLLAEVNKVLARPLTRADVCGAYAGLRPVVRKNSFTDSRTLKASSGGSVATVAPGIVALAGGKLTSYRKMAADAVDLLLGRQQSGARPSVSARTPLVGAQGLEAMTNQSARIGSIYGWNPDQMEHLLERYGSDLPEILELVDDDPTMAAPLYSAPDYLRVDVAWACTAEGAMHLEDIMLRRLRLYTDCADRGLAAAAEVAGIAGPLLDWDDERVAWELENYRAMVGAEEAALQQSTDAAALAERTRAKDIVESGLDKS